MDMKHKVHCRSCCLDGNNDLHGFQSTFPGIVEVSFTEHFFPKGIDLLSSFTTFFCLVFLLIIKLPIPARRFSFSK